MTAHNCCLKRDEILVSTDGCSYTDDGVLRSFVQKTYAMPLLNAAISGAGTCGLTLIFAAELQRVFGTFDDMIADIEMAMPLLLDRYKALGEIAEGDYFSVEIAGFSESRNRPESYSLSWYESGNDAHWTKELPEHQRLKLRQSHGLSCSPNLDPADMLPAGINISGTKEQILERFGELEMLALLELQRQRAHSRRPGDEPRYWVGGSALITSITRSGITQRVVHTWNDRRDELITPEPVNWPQWHDRHRKLRRVNSTANGKSRKRR